MQSEHEGRGMDRPAFERYLKTRYVKQNGELGMEVTTATDVASRCLRVETAFGVELDDVIDRNELSALIEQVKSVDGRKRLNYVGTQKKWYSHLTAALEKYAKFRGEQPLQ